MVTIATGHHPAMDLNHQSGVQRTVRRQPREPPVGRDRCSRLALRKGFELLGRFAHCEFEFPIGKLRPFDSRSARNLPLELDLLQFVGPTPLIGDPSQGHHGRFGPDQLVHDCHPVIGNPVPRNFAANHA